MNNNNFIHFSSNYECNKFIEYANQQNIYHIGTCCKGTGCKFNLESEILNKLKKKFISQSNIKLNTQIGFCNICFEDEQKLYKICNFCIEPICEKCKIKITNCPFCRNKLPTNLIQY